MCVIWLFVLPGTTRATWTTWKGKELKGKGKVERPPNIIGRGLVIHEDEDDCGLGVGNKKKESLITGNSGKRIACAVIGYAKENYK